jgi:alpha-galactosidase
VVDDGYEQKVGDWYPPWRGFPNGPARLAESIRERGLQPGLWLAPFVVEAASRTVRDHPDWVLRRGDGRPVSIGLLGGHMPYALDSTHPGVLEHLASLVETAVSEWGFELLKLDFLYAAALQGRRHDPRLTRAQAFGRALSRLRRAAAGAWIVGCGCPLGPAIGLVDSMRISPDVGPSWYPHYRGVHAVLRAEVTAPGARNSLRNAIHLAPLHRRWWINDPDCVLLQPEASGWADAAPAPLGLTAARADRWRIPRRMRRLGLAAHEVQTLVTVDSLTGGVIMDSDHLPELEPIREEWLAALLPPLNRRARAVDWFDAAYPSCLVLPLDDASGLRWLVALVNWSESTARMQVDLERLGIPAASSYHAVGFWDGSYSRLEGDTLVAPLLPPHGVHFVCLRPDAGGPAWLGDTFHISMGSAVRSLERDGAAALVDLELPRRATGIAWLSLPAAPTWVRTETGPVGFELVEDHVVRVPLAWNRSAHLEIGWAEPWAISEAGRAGEGADAL